jgi:hypothetical protein
VNLWRMIGHVLRMLFIFTCCLPVRAGINLNTAAAERSIVFIYPSKPDGQVDEAKPAGTGFLIGVPMKTRARNGYLLLVTARHMVDPQWAMCPIQNPARIFLRINLKKGSADANIQGFRYLPVDLKKDGQLTYATNDDDSADVAVVLLTEEHFKIDQLKYDDFDATPLSVAEFGTPDETKNLAIGDGVVSAGLLPAFPGALRNYPLFKFGYISNIPLEPVPIPCTPNQTVQPRKMTVWFLAINLVSGNSGSPIFYAPFGGNGVALGGGRAMIIGLQSGSFFDADVSEMTPVQFIFDVIQKLKLNEADLYRGSPRAIAPQEQK